MKHKVVSIIVPVVVVAIVVAGTAYAITRDSGGADAMTIDGTSVSQATVNQELQALAKLPDNSVTTPGAVDSRLAAGWLTTRVRAAALENLLHRKGFKIASNELPRLRTAVEGQYPGLPTSAQDVIAVFNAANAKLADQLQTTDPTKLLNREMRKLDVSVDPKYGRWVPAKAEVCAPTGCVAQSTQSSSSGG
jgi:hypothetical protein